MGVEELSEDELLVLNSVVTDATIDRITEAAAREYEMNMRNAWFDDKPDERHKLLVRIIGGAHVLITRAL